MGNIDQIDQLETYIIDLGNEIESVKKASDYLRLIEELQAEIKKTSSTLGQSNQQLKLIQEVVESKLELYLTSTRNIEAKQQQLEQSLLNVNASLAELKQQQEKGQKGMIAAFREMNKLLSQNKEVVVGEVTRVEKEQKELLLGMVKTNKVHFGISTFFSLCLLGLLVYLMMN
jgi:chromosome segregation ATPase